MLESWTKRLARHLGLENLLENSIARSLFGISQSNMAGHTNSNDDDHAQPSDSANQINIDVDALKQLLDSNSSQDVVKLNRLVTQIIEAKQLEVFKSLLEQGYKIDVMNEKRQTALHLLFYKAAQDIKYKIGNRLLYNCIGDTNHTDSQKLSLLHIASYLGIVDKVRDFLENNEDKNAIFYCKTFNNSTTFLTPIHLAALNHQLSTVKLLLEYGANICPINDCSVTPLHLAAGYYSYPFHPSCDEHFYVDVDILKALIRQKSNLNAQDESGNTPLMSIYSKFFYDQCEPSEEEEEDSETESQIITQMIKCIKLDKVQKQKLMVLLQHGADVTLRNNAGDTILHRVIGDLQSLRRTSDANDISFNDCDHVDMVKKILNNNSKIADVKNKLEATPLQLAVSHMSGDVIQVLLDHGADLKNVNLAFDTENCFWDHHIHPNFESVQNLMSVVHMLVNKGFLLTPIDKLAVLTFLVHNTNECKCWTEETMNNIYEIENLLSNASVEHINSILEKENRFSQAKYNSDKIEMTRLEYNFILYCQVKMMSGSFYEKERFNQILDSIQKRFGIEDSSLKHDQRIINEIAQMESIQLQSNVNLLDVLKKHPHDIYKYISNTDYSFFKQFNHLESFVKGHFTKGLIRHYVKQLSESFVEKLLYPNLSDVCRDEIIQYLDNKDILNMCLADVIGYGAEETK